MRAGVSASWILQAEDPASWRCCSLRQDGSPVGWDSGRKASDRMGLQQDGPPEVMRDQRSQLTAFNNSIRIDSLNWEQALKVTLKHTFSGETPTLSNSKEDMDKTKEPILQSHSPWPQPQGQVQSNLSDSMGENYSYRILGR